MQQKSRLGVRIGSGSHGIGIAPNQGGNENELESLTTTLWLSIFADE
jgi:hypothetical protein